MSVFQRLKFGSKIVGRCNVAYLQEIAFDYLVRANKVIIISYV